MQLHAVVVLQLIKITASKELPTFYSMQPLPSAWIFPPYSLNI